MRGYQYAPVSRAMRMRRVRRARMRGYVCWSGLCVCMVRVSMYVCTVRDGAIG